MIEIRGLVKDFGRLRVLDRLHLTLAGGKVTAILGPNASGKTTLIKCMLGLTHYQEGTIAFEGTTLDGASTYRANIGYMPQVARFPGHLRGKEVITMLKDLRGCTETPDGYLLDAFQLGNELDKALGTLSGGTRQKISAVLAFLFDPAVLFLDEPTAGLDPFASSTLKDRILASRDANKTIVLTSHIMSEIEELADHVAFLLNGKVHFFGPSDALKAATGEDRLERALARMMKNEGLEHSAHP